MNGIKSTHSRKNFASDQRLKQLCASCLIQRWSAGERRPSTTRPMPRDEVHSRSRSRRSEREPLLVGRKTPTTTTISVQDPIDGAHLHADDSGGASWYRILPERDCSSVAHCPPRIATSGESFDDVPHEKRQIGRKSLSYIADSCSTALTGMMSIRSF